MTPATGVAALVTLAAATGIAFQQAAGVPVFRARADAVLVGVSVRQGDKPVAGLTVADFEVKDNEVTQTLDFVSIEPLPVDVSIVLDASFYAGAAAPRALLVIHDIAGMLRPDDRIRIIVFGNTVTTRVPYAPAGAIVHANEVAASGFRAKNEAVQFALTRPRDPERRQLVVVFTDGTRDLGSPLPSDALPSIASHSDAAMHVVLGPHDWASQQALANAIDGGTGFAAFVARRAATNFSPELRPLTDAAMATGGLVYQATETAASLSRGFQQVFDDYLKSYLIAYVPTGVPRAGWHDLAVRVRTSKDYSVNVRRGYFGG